MSAIDFSRLIYNKIRIMSISLQYECK